MGIPSYYRKLCSAIKGLRSNFLHGSNNVVNWFFMDFNCLIYHCLHRADTPVYRQDTDKDTPVYRQDNHDAWEQEFIECIVVYCRKVIQHVAPTKGVYIAIDGVVPMAKMRQQRLRRFKSVWLKKNGLSESGTGWDTNAITPGTAFMTKLRAGLEQMIKLHGNGAIKWQLSSSDEPGEGEHKIIAQWRTGQYTGNFAVYGLDADLIVLSMLAREQCGLQNQVWLFREEVDKGKMVYDAAGEEAFEWFSIHALRDWLCAAFPSVSLQTQFILNYCFAMSILGNDFLPSSLGYKIREDGHSQLIQTLYSLAEQGVHLIEAATNEINNDGVHALFSKLAANEPDRILAYIVRKQQQSRNAPETGMGENNWPLGHVEENIFMSDHQLHPAWRIKYVQQFGMVFNAASVQVICQEYLRGIQWIWAYYTGRMVCYNWFYPYSLPPLWEYLATAAAMPPPGDIVIQAHQIRPVEQLALVLPLESWSLLPKDALTLLPKDKLTLLPKDALTLLPKLAPQYYPEHFSFDSMGKRFFWECEALIPLPTIMEVKAIIAAHQ